jgi:hypothetical protein
MTAPGISTVNPTPTAQVSQTPAGNKMAIDPLVKTQSEIPRAKTASHAGLLRAQFRALRLSGILNEV